MSLHSSYEELLKDQDWTGLATTLHIDLRDLSSVMDIYMPEDDGLMRTILLELRKTWFEIEESLPDWRDKSSAWSPTEALRQEYQEIAKSFP